MRLWTTIALAAHLGCGSGGGGDTPDGAPGQGDAAADCAAQSLEIGRCAVTGGASCAGVAAEQPGYQSLEPGGEVPLVYGFQGALMLPLAIRTSGIYPGEDSTPSEQPRVDAVLRTTDGAQVAGYQNGVTFTEVAGDPDTYEWLFVFLIMSGATDDIVGLELQAEITVTDRDGEVRCGEKRLTAGPP